MIPDDKLKGRVVSTLILLCFPSSPEIIMVDERDGKVEREEREGDTEEAPTISTIVRRVPYEEEMEGGRIESNGDKVLEEGKMEEIGIVGEMVSKDYVTNENTLPSKGISKGVGVPTIGVAVVLVPTKDENTIPALPTNIIGEIRELLIEMKDVEGICTSIGLVSNPLNEFY